MAEILKANKTALRGCILNEFLQGKSIDEAYKSFCKTIGNDVIKYEEFKNWFNCFANGKSDLEDENFDKEPLTFSDLPAEILGEIVENLDLVSRLKTRKVSRVLRSVVDKQKAHYDYIGIDTDDNKISITFDDISVDYKNKENGCSIEYRCFGEDQTKQKFINGNYLQIALNDLEIALKKPKFQLETLGIFFQADDNVNEKIIKFIESLKTPVHLRSINILSEADYDAVRIVSMLKPGTLEEIEIGCGPKTNVNQLVKMEQWKQAKQLGFGGIPVRFEECLHFDCFDIFVKSVSPEDVVHARDVLSKSPNFEYCRLSQSYHHRFNVEEIGRALGAALVRDNRGWKPVTHRHPIPGTDEVLDFEIDHYLTIERKQPVAN